MNEEDDKTVITNNRIEKKSNYQNKLGANRYVAFRDDNDDDWNTHISQYVEKEEKPGRRREIGKATKRHAPNEEEAIRYDSVYGSLIKRMSEIKKETKRHAPKGEEANGSVKKEPRQKK